jgi:hypothetical protein
MEKESMWINAKECAPKDGDMVLCWDEKNSFHVCVAFLIKGGKGYREDMVGVTLFPIRSSGCGCCDGEMEGDVYWTELPSPPLEVNA